MDLGAGSDGFGLVEETPQEGGAGTLTLRRDFTGTLESELLLRVRGFSGRLGCGPEGMGTVLDTGTTMTGVG
jgi:hypothetical protein